MRIVFFLLLLGSVVISGCNEDDITTVTIVTSMATNITSTTATSGGQILSDGPAEVGTRGICWNALPNPTINNFNTTSGSGLGVFSANLTDLRANTVYHIRAWAETSQGLIYGNDVVFTTEE